MEALRNRSSVISILNRNLLFLFILIAMVPTSAMYNFRRVRFDDSINYNDICEAAKSNNVSRLRSLLAEASVKRQKIAGELSNKLSALLHRRHGGPRCRRSPDRAVAAGRRRPLARRRRSQPLSRRRAARLRQSRRRPSAISQMRFTYLARGDRRIAFKACRALQSHGPVASIATSCRRTGVASHERR